MKKLKIIFCVFFLLVCITARGQLLDDYSIDWMILGYDVPHNFLILNDVFQKDKQLLKQNNVAKITCYNSRDKIINEIKYINRNGLVTNSSNLFNKDKEHFTYEYDKNGVLILVTSSGEREEVIDHGDHYNTIMKSFSSEISFLNNQGNIFLISGLTDSSRRFIYNLYYDSKNRLEKYIFAENYIFRDSDLNKLDTTIIEYNDEDKVIVLEGQNYNQRTIISYRGDTIKISSDYSDTYGHKYVIKENRVTEALLFRNATEIIYSRFYEYDEKGLLIKKIYKNNFDNAEFNLQYTYEYYE